LELLAQLGGFFFHAYGARRGLEGTFQPVAFGHGRCGPRHKPGGPPLLEFSLKVKRNSAHNQSSAFVDAPVLEALTRVIDLRSVAGSPDVALKGRTVANAEVGDHALAQAGQTRPKRSFDWPLVHAQVSCMPNSFASESKGMPRRWRLYLVEP
jgi:hypothetical protein